jgi:NAD(P)-dependent dehydrogenase (short-subunit alcohol dehydrogenase family)
MSSDSDSDLVAVVTGATRGAGKGIAIALGQAGMTVYVTGRSTAPADSPFGGTVQETAVQVTQAGGRGIAVVVDHNRDAEVEALFSTIQRDHGKLDILVNNAAKVPPVLTSPGFWERRIDEADLITVGLRSHYIASYYAAPLLIASGAGLIVNTGHYGAVSYHQGPAYGAQKAGSDKMIADMAKELRPHGVAAVSIWMGGLDTERARAYFDSLPEQSRPKARRESPEFSGHLIAGLQRSPERMRYSGRALIGVELGLALGVTEADGTLPNTYRYALGGPPELHRTLLD